MCFTCFNGLYPHNSPVSQWCIKDEAVGAKSKKILTLMKIPLLFIKTVVQPILTASERKYSSLKTKGLGLIKVLNNDYDHWWPLFTYVCVNFKLANLDFLSFVNQGSWFREFCPTVSPWPSSRLLFKRIPSLPVVGAYFASGAGMSPILGHHECTLLTVDSK